MWSGESGTRQTWSSSRLCRTVASSRRHASGRSARTAAFNSTGSGRSSRWKPSPASSRRCPRRPPRRGRRGASAAETSPYPEDRTGRLHRGGGRQPGQDAVDGAHPQRVAGGVHEQDQAEVPGCARVVGGLEPAVGGPAVVAVGDQRLAAGEVGVDGGQFRGVGQGPQPVVDAVLGGGGQQRLGVLGRAVDDGGRSRRRRGRRAAGVRGWRRWRASGRRGRRPARGITSSCGRTTPSSGGLSRSAPITPRWRWSPSRCSYT